jgi:hypothetical protein
MFLKFNSMRGVSSDQLTFEAFQGMAFDITELNLRAAD